MSGAEFARPPATDEEWFSMVPAGCCHLPMGRWIGRGAIGLSLILAWACPSRADAILDRSLREAGVILNLLLRERAGKLAPCSLSTKWLSKLPVDGAMARKYLGLTLHADLLAPDVERSPSDVIDPAGAMKDAFCDAGEAKKVLDRRLADFKSGTLVIEKQPTDLYPRLMTVRIELMMPVFDDHFKTAIVNVTYDQLSWTKNQNGAKDVPSFYDSDGVSKFGTIMGVGLSYVFRKKNRAWHLIGQEEIYRVE